MGQQDGKRSLYRGRLKRKISSLDGLESSPKLYSSSNCSPLKEFGRVRMEEDLRKDRQKRLSMYIVLQLYLVHQQKAIKVSIFCLLK